MWRLESVSFIFENVMGMLENLLTMDSVRLCFLRVDSGVKRGLFRRCDDRGGRREGAGQCTEEKRFVSACSLDGLSPSTIVITPSHSAQPVH